MFHIPAAIEAPHTTLGHYTFRDEAILGTRMQIHVTARNYSDAQAAAFAVRGEIDRLNGILNSRDPASELSVLNRSNTHRASPELFAVVELAERWRRETAGAFSGRLGSLIAKWDAAREATPSREELLLTARGIEDAQIHLDAATRTITRPRQIEFALDAAAKGWIVDRAFDVARASAGVHGALINIGGDIRCGGQAPDEKGWCVGIPDTTVPVDNAPLNAFVYLTNQAIATSGVGPRNRTIGSARYSPTLSSRDGWPVRHAVTVSAIASTAAEADAAATTLLALPTSEAIEWADRKSIHARIVTEREVILTPSSRSGSGIRFAAASSVSKAKSNAARATRWPKDWGMLATFTAPPRQLVRDQHFRSPYMAMWISDLNNKPIRTLLLVGTHLDWQEDNYIWWSTNGENVKHLAATRSMSTSGTGVYKMLWDGTDDQFQEVPAGTYILHVETSRERGKHTHRSLTLDFSEGKPFTDQLPTTEEAGGLVVNFYHP